MTSPQEIAREKRRQKEVSATELFEKSGLKRQSTGMLWNKKDAWVIPYRSTDQKIAIKNLLEQAGVINVGSLVLPDANSGNIIINAESGLGKSLEQRRLEHEAGKHPDWFRYERLTGDDAQKAGYYIPYKTNAITHCHHDNFAHIDWSADENYDSTGKADIDLNSGAKFHLSIAERDLPRAWDAIAQSIIKHHINCKVMRPLASRLPVQKDAADKKIVIYIPRSQLLDAKKVDSWKSILAEMDATLHEQGIAPAGVIASDKAVDGSEYLYYRYGKTIYYEHDGKAANRWDDGLEEATGGVDVFSDLKINRATPTTARDGLFKAGAGHGFGKA